MMMQKLFAVVQNKCCVEGADGLMMHELLLGGHLYLQMLKEKMQSWLQILKSIILKKANLTADFTLNTGKQKGVIFIVTEVER
jgi:DNA-directed RNA polymerase I subunit RPA2